MTDERQQILNEIAAAKARLESNVQALTESLPPGAVVAAQAKKYGALAGGGALVLGVGAAMMKSKAAAKARRRELELTADVLASRFTGMLPVMLERPASEKRSGSTSKIALAAALAALALAGLQFKQGQSSLD